MCSEFEATSIGLLASEFCGLEQACKCTPVTTQRQTYLLSPYRYFESVMLSLRCALNLKHQAFDLSSNLIVCIQFNNTCRHSINTKTHFFLQLVSVAELVKQNKLCPAQVEVPCQCRVLEAPGTQVEGKLITVFLLHQLHTKLQDFRILGLDVCQPCHRHTKSQSITKSCISSTQSFKISESWAWYMQTIVKIIQNQSVTNCHINSIQSFRIS